MTTKLQATPPDHVLRDEERQVCEVWTRVMGYHRPVSSFNRGKQGEHRERVPFRYGEEESCQESA